MRAWAFRLHLATCAACGGDSDCPFGNALFDSLAHALNLSRHDYAIRQIYGLLEKWR